MRFLKTAVSLGATVLALCTAVTPVSAAPSAPRPGHTSGKTVGLTAPASTTPTASVADWTTIHGQGPVRSCYAASCDIVWTIDWSNTIQWSHYAYNSKGNRWFYIRIAFNSNSDYVYGWIYCGNVTASC